MAGATDIQEVAMLNAALDVSGKYVGLFTTLPNDAGSGGVEVSTTGTNYARVSIASTDWAAAIAGTPPNPTTKSGPKSGVSWTFGVPGATAWGTVIGWGIFNASSGSIATTCEWFGDLTVSKAPVNGDPAPVFNSTHQITVQLGDLTDSF